MNVHGYSASCESILSWSRFVWSRKCAKQISKAVSEQRADKFVCEAKKGATVSDVDCWALSHDLQDKRDFPDRFTQLYL